MLCDAADLTQTTQDPSSRQDPSIAFVLGGYRGTSGSKASQYAAIQIDIWVLTNNSIGVQGQLF